MMNVATITYYAARAYAWVTADSFNLTATMMLATFFLVFVASQMHNNYSWVDRTWSIVPVVYAWTQAYFTATRGVPGSNAPCVNVATLFCALITLWGARLTFNFYRRGGYFRGGEDYRWNYVRTWPVLCRSLLLWTLFNLLVISLFQCVLLWAITLPVASLPASKPRPTDFLMAGTMFAFIVLEAVADEQQWRFQQAKTHRGSARTPELVHGFCVTGVFGYSRHMNVFSEGCIWIVLALAAYSQTWTPLPWWQCAGCVVLLMLTWFSTGVITERLSSGRYSGYCIYQRTTPMLLPSISSSTARTLYLLRKKQKRSS